MPMFRVLASKDPDALVAYQFDLSGFFQSIEGDALDTADVFTVNDAGQIITTDLTVESVSYAASGVVTYFLSGGTHGRDYRVQCRLQGARTAPVRLSDRISAIVPVRQL